MSGKAVAGLAGALLAPIICCVAGLGFAGGGIAMAACAAPTTATRPAGAGAVPAGAGAWPTVGTWTSEQVTNAATIVTVGQQMHVPARGWVIAVATAMQESGLHNLGDLGSANDTDSLGLFQQRTSQGWGTPAQTSTRRTPPPSSTSASFRWPTGRMLPSPWPHRRCSAAPTSMRTENGRTTHSCS